MAFAEDESGTHYAVEMNADSAGRLEYAERRHDVEVCGEPDVWCWPLGDADEAYIKRVGIPWICQELGIAQERWQTWAVVWIVTFRKGYEAAHAEHLRNESEDLL